MANALQWTGLALVLLSIGVPVSSAQLEPAAFLYQFSLTGPTGTVPVEINGVAEVHLTFSDLSRDSSTTFVGSGGSVFYHSVDFTAVPDGEDTQGWVPQTITPLITQGGQEHDVAVRVALGPTATNPFFRLNVTSHATTDGGVFNNTIHLLFFTDGIPGFSVRSAASFELGPREVGQAGLLIRNGALLPRTFQAEVAQNPCNLLVGLPPTVLVQPQETVEVGFTIQGPEERAFYLSQDCTLGIAVFATDNPNVRLSASVGVVVNGGYVNPVWVFWTVAIILAILLIVLLVARRKARIEEEILGKPQKPWTIPVEVLYLKALRQKDERAWYVVRHHLMEEEYRSSLLWYKSYKKATKGARKKEAVVIRQEKAYERWKASWAKAIAKPIKEADRFEAKLQRKLDRQAAKQERKMAGKVRGITRKMAAAHAKQVERALEKWQKQLKKAEKKGLAAPPRPVLPEPDYPEEPEVEAPLLAQHKWSKKAARFRARQVRKQGNLEVKFEKADARKLAKLRRKVQRLARKLDDPDFVNEHPLLKADA